jgi:uncharacterized membrane protein
MYTIIGGDGKEYGPVSAEQVRGWLAGGRANLDTKIKTAGSEEWKTVADFPEIVGGAVTPSPAAGSVTPRAVAFPAAAKLDIMSCYERSWNMLKADFWPSVGAALVMALVYGAIYSVQRRGPVLVAPFLGGLLGGGFYYYFLLKARGLPAKIGDLFSGFTRAFVPLLLIGIIMPVFVAVAFLCLILPGIYLLVAYSFAYLAATDKQVGFWEAMELSRKTVTRHWWSVLGLLLLGIPFMILGAVALGVGLLVAMPLVMGAIAFAYEDLFNPRG